MPTMFVCFLAATVLADERALRPDGLRFTAGENGEYLFNTGELSGKLRSEGKSVGLFPVIHIASGKVLTRSMGFAGHYRVFSGSNRFGGGAWYWPSDAKLLDDGAVEMHWPAAEDRPFDMWAVYRLVGPATIDVETRVRPRVDLSDFETFVAWYFADDFTSALVYARDERGRKAFVPAEQQYGAWQIFPRDSAAVRLIQDGRWKAPPNPVDWAIRAAFDRPLAVRRILNSGLTALLMAPSRDCFAVSMPHEADPHRSVYLSLFGRTIRTGETARARTRTVIMPAATPEQMLRVHDEFVRQVR
jgi:hypothetical protein